MAGSHRLAFLLVALLAGPAVAANVTPIQKVLELMDDMLKKGIAMKKEEAVKFSAFSQWCTDQTRIKTDEINEGNDKIEKLEAEIEEATVLIKQLTARIEELEEDVGRWKKDQNSASDVRDKEKKDYIATDQDYTESIDALSQAIAVLKKQAYDRPQAEESEEVVQSLLQVERLRLLPAHSKAAVRSFLQLRQPDLAAEDTPDDRLFYEAPEANAYEFQSGGVVEMLHKLKKDFGDKKRDLETEELNAQHAFEQIMQQLNDNIENANHEIAKKTARRAETMELKAELEGDLAETTKERDEDQKYLDEMTALCEQKKKDFESRQALRTEEIDSLQKAIEIISSPEVSGAGEKYLPTLLQYRSQTHAAGSKAAFAQLRAEQRNPPLQRQIAAFLSERARLSNSRLLSDIAAQVEANPFGKVKKMIKDLIVKLMEEATAETEHKGWCDTELATNKQTREKKTADAEELTNTIDELNAEIAQLTQDIADLTAAVKELDEAMAKATEEREASKAVNTETVKDAKEAQVAVTQAIALLKDYYAKSAEATALVQQTPAEDAPPTFEKPYKGMLPEGGSVVDFLEVILTDFARLESETAAAEAQEEEEYKNFMFESTKDKALKENAIGHKTESKTNKESALKQAEIDLKETQEELQKAIAYFEKLKPTCVDSGISYEERVKQREAEIVSLQEALKILTGVDMGSPAPEPPVAE